MTHADWLFDVSLGLSVAAFGLFAWLVISGLVRKTFVPVSPNTGLGAAEQQSLNVAEIAKQLGDLTNTFAKSGPIPTSAVLCIFFALIALMSSGVIKIGQ
jgi:hypothetical protein